MPLSKPVSVKTAGVAAEAVQPIENKSKKGKERLKGGSWIVVITVSSSTSGYEFYSIDIQFLTE
jgi:hypothetical protein